MNEALVLLHGSANGSYSWGAVFKELGALPRRVFVPDMLGYGSAPAPSAEYGIAEEVAYLKGLLDAHDIGEMHLVAHSVGVMYGLHLRRALGARVTRLTLLDPVLVSVLREQGEEEGYAEMQGQYDRFMERLPDHAAAARTFVEHWSGAGVWDTLGQRARAVITGLAPKIRLEMIEARSDTTRLAELAASPPPTTILIGEHTRIAPRATARHLGEALRATSMVVPGAAHMIPLTHAAAVADVIRN
ncbi:alpha/beta fold hydrolase [Chondromyces apiculatus]|uniref:Alpha/beta hydrolase fold protein n=1 Tax=Chondromyces apiculatus DSM 436 TaxID=1192034 RepID=A0A017TG78_9BACT|nr:alpha/beta hydrolase [Chondromyces apiculatus]EYF08249.1 alpha/beta hydrolase fold protein [Chondromyces apiculatus DSM 436]